MALVICPECGKEISSEARSCPNCGKHLKSRVVNKKAFFGIGIVAVAIIVWAIVVLFSNPLRNTIYTGIMPGMTWKKVETKFSSQNYTFKRIKRYDTADLDRVGYGGIIKVVPVKNPREFSFFGYPVDILEIRFDKEYKVDCVGGRVDLSYRSDISDVQEDVYEQLSKIGTNVNKSRRDFTFRINDSPYAIYVDFNRIGQQYMEVEVFYADSGFYGT